MKKLMLIGLITALAVIGVNAQTNTPSQAFYRTVMDYFTTFDTNSTTFIEERGSVWTGVDSISESDVSLANSLGISYKLGKTAISAESVLRNSGVAGTLVSEQVGIGLNFVVYDAKLTLYGDAGYDFLLKDVKRETDRLFGEIGLRAQKAMTKRTYAGASFGVQVPESKQVFSVFAGFTY